jgi:ABC-type transporter Mla maintaining outer membrane lipid asymmetry ATPase subunit MlaF
MSPRWTTHSALALRGRVGLMFQYNALFDSMTVAENTAYGLHERLWGTR